VRYYSTELAPDMEEEEEEEEQEEVGREMIDCHGRCRGYGIATVVDLVA